MSLSKKKCVPWTGAVHPLTLSQIDLMMNDISSGWTLTHENTRLFRRFELDSFCESMDFANEIAKMAREEQHHPVLHVQEGYLDVEVWTLKVNALVESDFIFASKVDRLYIKREEFLPLMT